MVGVEKKVVSSREEEKKRGRREGVLGEGRRLLARGTIIRSMKAEEPKPP